MKQRKAFTIIEVVLVLAIAGLIFLMVFIALPALQRSQRNTRRRQDLARIVTAVNDYQSNNNKLPFPYASTSGVVNNIEKGFVSKYVDSSCTAGTITTGYKISVNGGAEITLKGQYKNCGEQFTDPDGTPYNIYSPILFDSGKQIYQKSDGTMPSFEDNQHFIIALNNAKCSTTENKAEDVTGNNYFALFYLLEGGSVYCVDNQ